MDSLKDSRVKQQIHTWLPSSAYGAPLPFKFSNWTMTEETIKEKGVNRYETYTQFTLCKTYILCMLIIYTKKIFFNKIE